MRFASVCSGIDAASVAWIPLGWECVFLAEIEKFPCSVLKHHYPTTPNYGDITKFRDWPDHSIDVLIGGTPCQSFSVAGLRAGLRDPRGNLALTFLAIAQRYRPRWILWENVPGVHSSWSDETVRPPTEEECLRILEAGGDPDEYECAEQTNDFDCFLSGLEQLGYGIATTILDAQYFGLAQRRERVFVVGHSGGQWQRSAAVLFDAASVRGDSAPSREKGKRVAPTLDGRAGRSGCNNFATSGGLEIAQPLRSGRQFSDMGDGQSNVVADIAPTLSARTKGGGGLGTDAECDGAVIPILEPGKRTGKSTDDIRAGLGIGEAGDPMFTLQSGAQHGIAHAFDARQSPELEVRNDGTANAILTPNGGRGGIGVGAIHRNAAVRRLTPLECERLQGFPDNYTKITEKTADGPRYKALGNSMAVPVIRWLGERIELVDDIPIYEMQEV